MILKKEINFFDFFRFFISLESQCQSSFFQFYKISKIFFWKMASMGPLECWKKQSHEKWAHLGHPLRSHARSSTCACGFHPPPMWYRENGIFSGRHISTRVDHSTFCFKRAMIFARNSDKWGTLLWAKNLSDSWFVSL